jgi:hypothetical protein
MLNSFPSVPGRGESLLSVSKKKKKETSPPDLSWAGVLHTYLWSPQICVEALTPNVTVFGDKALEEVIKIKWGHKCGP